MKKIIGLIMIAGISYGAQIVTPPGIQVNGLATNNNVMVYSNGMLLDSGVAPTNLVSVTNLTADIEALSATNAAQDALIAGNLYADGTTNKTLIDAAIAISTNSLLLTTSQPGIVPPTNGFHVLFMGQSNATGYGDDVAFTNVDFFAEFGSGLDGCFANLHTQINTYTNIGPLSIPYYYDMWSSEMRFMPMFRTLLDQDVYLTKYSSGGTGLASDWAKSQNKLYTNIVPFVAETTNEYSEAGSVDLIVWSQGEQDCTTLSYATNYYSNLTNFIADLRSDLGVSNCPVILTGMAEQYDDGSYLSSSYVSAAQRNVAEDDPYVEFVYLGDLPTKDGVHFTSTSLLEMGQRVVRAYNRMTAEKKIPGVYAGTGTFDNLAADAVVGRAGHFQDLLVGGRDISEIRYDMRPISSHELVFYYGCNESNLTTVTDWYSNYTGTVSSPSNSVAWLFDESLGRGVYKMNSTGTANNDTITTSVSVNGEPYLTFFGWFRIDSKDVVTGNPLFLGKRSTGTGIGIGYTETGEQVIMQATGAATGSIHGKKRLLPGAWHHICGVWNGTTASLYIDGELHDSGTCTTTTESGNLNINIGLYAADKSPLVSFSDVGVFKRAISADEVKRLYYGSPIRGVEQP